MNEPNRPRTTSANRSRSCTHVSGSAAWPTTTPVGSTATGWTPQSPTMNCTKAFSESWIAAENPVPRSTASSTTTSSAHSASVSTNNLTLSPGSPEVLPNTDRPSPPTPSYTTVTQT